MTSTLVPVLNELTEYEKLNVIDVGSARASFIIELKKVYTIPSFSMFSNLNSPLGTPAFSNSFR